MAKKTKWFIIVFTLFLFFLLQIIVYMSYKHYASEASTSLKEDLTKLSTTLTAVTNEKFAFLRGIEAYIRTTGFDADEATMLSFLNNIYGQSQQIRSIVIAPQGVVKHAIPTEGNESLIGVDYLTNPAIATPHILQRTLQSRVTTMDGPRELKQGGLGMIARKALFDGDEFLGIVAISVNFDDLIDKSGIRVALTKNDSYVITDMYGSTLFGNANTLTKEHFSVPILLLNEQWILSATPAWADKMNTLVLTVVIEIIGLIILSLIFITFRRQFLFGVRLEHLVAKRTKALSTANEDLLAVEEELRYQNELLENRTIELEISERRYEKLAYNDALTGISNRLYFIETFALLLQQKQQSSEKMALLFFDVNQFKVINDTFGHIVGDQLLIAITRRITNSDLGHILFARLGGDEFVLVMDNVVDDDGIREHVERILALFDAHFQIEHLCIQTSIRVGIAIYPDHGNALDDLMKHADLAMHYAKKTVGIDYRFFDNSMMEELIQNRDFPSRFTNAMTDGEIVLYYQPQINIQTGRIIGLEALVRWISPDKGMIYPSEFIPLAEDMGLITELTDYVIEEACRQLAIWREKGLPIIKISINLSSAWLFKRNVVQEFFATLDRYQVSPSDLELEITENIAVMDESYPVLEELLQAGVSIAIDDFGLAYSSLSYLKRFPINKIKIDRSFISGIGQNHIDETIVQAISFITERLNYEVIAEGVEEGMQADFLHTHGCPFAQGYLYYRPMPAEEIEQLLQDNDQQ